MTHQSPDHEGHFKSLSQINTAPISSALITDILSQIEPSFIRGKCKFCVKNGVVYYLQKPITKMWSSLIIALLGLWPLTGLLFIPWMIYEHDEPCGMILMGKPTNSEQKLPQCHFVYLKIPHGLTRVQNWASMTRSQWLTAWAMARPPYLVTSTYVFSYGHWCKHSV
jgi:hypothetical protein